MGKDATVIIEQLKAKHLNGVSLDKTIEKVAKENGKSPADLFEMLKTPKEKK